MRYWDTSSLVPLFVQQPTSHVMRTLYESDSHVLAWSLTEVEVRSAVCRYVREGGLAAAAADAAMTQFQILWSRVVLVSSVDSTKMRAMRLLARTIHERASARS